ncbi:uncharacterized protein LOC115875300 [Sitophilus oryzae]|uniref:Uncharacterized protein LOC115875300 n=1 Tax=Sitophilus oryzae TaxID=7048 RepID=A0A6J2X5X6_SITOR|nr:uncharacterized protein LOC115875300 [Sitophilus oryzae]
MTEIDAALAPRQRRPDVNEQENTVNKAFLPYVSQVTDRIGKFLKKHNIKTIYKPTRKIKDCLRPGSTVYLVPAVAYILELPNAQSERDLQNKREAAGLGQTEKSATSGYHPRLVREAVEIHKHPNNFNRKEETFYLNRIWQPVTSRTKVEAQRSRPVPEELPPEQARPLRRRRVNQNKDLGFNFKAILPVYFVVRRLKGTAQKDYVPTPKVSGSIGY